MFPTWRKMEHSWMVAQYWLKVCMAGGQQGPSLARAVEGFELGQKPPSSCFRSQALHVASCWPFLTP